MTQARSAKTSTTPAGKVEEVVVHDFVCTACGCTCDDLKLTVRGQQITAVEPPCPLAERYLLHVADGQDLQCLVDGRPADLNVAIEVAAKILRAATAPLIMGMERATVEAQRLAVELADHLGAFIDPTDEYGTSRNHAAMQTVGAVTATLGEVAARSDLIVYWNVDPITTHPRHVERFARRTSAAADAPTSKRVICVATAPSSTSQAADEFLQLENGGNIAALATLRALIQGRGIDAKAVQAQTGAPLARWSSLAERLKTARYAAIFFEPAAGGQYGPDALSQGVTDLVRDLHRHTRAVALPLGAPWNAVGAAQVLTWQTGFPAAVSLARGYPHYLPGEASAAALLERGEVDAALIIGANPAAHLSAAARAQLAAIGTIVIDDSNTETAKAARVALLSSRFGIETTGSVYRSDGVALPLRPAMTPRLPSAESLLQQILDLIAANRPARTSALRSTP